MKQFTDKKITLVAYYYNQLDRILLWATIVSMTCNEVEYIR